MPNDNVRFLHAPGGALEGGGGGPHDPGMESRMASIEALIPTLATKADVAELRTEVHKGSVDIVKWIVGTGIAGLVLALTVMTFVLNNASPKAAPSAAPIVIQVPAAAAPAVETKPSQPIELPAKGD